MAGKYLDQEGLAYFWDQIKLSPEGKSVTTVDTIYDFPNVGKADVIYIVKSEGAVYRWDENAVKYYCIGRDYKEIEIISGGHA